MITIKKLFPKSGEKFIDTDREARVLRIKRKIKNARNQFRELGVKFEE